MSCNVVRSPAAVCAPVKRAAYSASAAEATTHEIMDEVVVIVPLMRVGSAWLPRKNTQPTTERDSDRERYEASTKTMRHMSQA